MNASLFLKKVNNKLFHSEERAYRKKFLLSRADEAVLKEESETVFPLMPKISILVPVFRTPIDFLNDMIESVVLQSYGNWELILANASPEVPLLSEELNHWAEKDARIVLFDLKENAGISENTNRAFERATGEFIALFDHDDMLEPDVLFEYVKALNENPETDVFYCDEDKITEDSNRFFFPNYKPDYNPDTLYSNNYVCHFLMMRRTVLTRIGGWRKEFDGAQDYDLILRLSRETRNIRHVPKILYHWRSHAASTAKSQDTKNYAATAGARAVKDHFDALGIPVTTEPGVHAGWVRIHYPEVKPAEIDTLFFQGETDGERLHSISEAFEKTEAPYVLLLREGMKKPGAALLSDLGGPLIRKETGAVAPRLLFPDNTVYRNGFYVNGNGEARPYFTGTPGDEPGFMCCNLTTRNVAALSAEVCMLRREVFSEILPAMKRKLEENSENTSVDSFGLLLSSCLSEAGYRLVMRSEVSITGASSKACLSKTRKPVFTTFFRENFRDTCYNSNFDKKGKFEA